MKLVRRHRKKILFVLMLFSLGAMTWGYLQRIEVVGGTDEPHAPRSTR